LAGAGAGWAQTKIQNVAGNTLVDSKPIRWHCYCRKHKTINSGKIPCQSTGFESAAECYNPPPINILLPI